MRPKTGSNRSGKDLLVIGVTQVLLANLSKYYEASVIVFAVQMPCFWLQFALSKSVHLSFPTADCLRFAETTEQT